MRLDKYLVEKNLTQSRQRAKELIQNGGVLCDGNNILKVNFEVDANTKIEIIGEDIPWVSRSGLKLAHALKEFDICVKDLVCADFGACTGGFTDVLLANNAKKVYAIDVGENQLAKKLKNDERVINVEKCNIRSLDKNIFREEIDFICIDVSFISLDKILPQATEVVKNDGIIIALIKPQFEVGKYNIKKGIVKDEQLHQKAIEKIQKLAADLNLTKIGFTTSPILGSKGNKEFLIILKK